MMQNGHAIFMSVMCAIILVVWFITLGRPGFWAAVDMWRTKMRRLRSHDESKLERQVVDEVVVQRGKNFARASEAHCLVASLVVAGVLLNVAIRYDRYMTPWQDYALLVFTGSTVIISNKPKLTRGRLLGMWYSFLMLISCFAVATGNANSSQFLFVESFLIPPRFMFSVAYGGTPLCVFWNAMYSVAFLVGYERSQGHTWPSQEGTWSVLLQTIWQREALIFSTVVFAVYITTEFLKNKARREIESKTLSGERSAMGELLNLVCDVVVELDGDLRIAHHAPKFAAFVTLQAHKDVQGMKLQQFMPFQEDSERFETSLRACTDDAGRTLPGALHTTMRDSLSNKVQVEIFYVHFHDPDHSSHYFVGVREFTDLASPSALSPAGAFSNRPSRHKSTHPHARSSPTWPSEVGREVGEETKSGGSLNEDTSSLGTSSHTTSTLSATGTKGLRIPHMKPTLDPAKDMMLADLVLHWNFCTRMTTCCPWHSSIMELKRSLRRLEGRSCSKQFGADFLKEVVYQCEACGVSALPDRLYLAERPSCCPACSGVWAVTKDIVCL
mmetsp:Transcript_166125/g.533207  ORF Transcript_166125/g.533207 Transcript_166125/m.533207 type:complete len:556 (-) Transcript_166125:165-1832(-)